MAEYILETGRIAAKLIQAFEACDNAAAQHAVEELEAHKKANQRLATDVAKYEAGTGQPERANPDDWTAKPYAAPETTTAPSGICWPSWPDHPAKLS